MGRRNANSPTTPSLFRCVLFGNRLKEMGHSITAIIVKGTFDETKAEAFDLKGIDLGHGLSLFHIDHHYSIYWQYLLKTEGNLQTGDIDSIVFPTESSIAEIVQRITEKSQAEFAIIQTEYFGGVGNQYASVFAGRVNIDKSIKSINEALRRLGVIAKYGLDEFETVGLKQIRSQPDYLEKYIGITEGLGL